MAGNLSRVSALLSRYESSFNRLIQLKTEQRLTQTNLLSSYENIASNILMSNEPGLMKMLFHLQRFQDDFLRFHRDSEYLAIQVVLESMGKKLADSSVMNDRINTYISSWRHLLDADFNLEKEIITINLDFDEISLSLMDLSSEIASKAADLSRNEIQNAERLRKKLGYSFLIFLGLGLAVLYLIIALIARKIVKPIKEMSDVVVEIKSGNTDVRFVSKDQDEVAQLGFAFNEMLDTIQENNRRLVSYQKDLEQKVQERTRELGVSEAKYRSLIESARDGLARFDEHGRVEFLNPICTEITGYTSNEMQELRLSEIVHPADWSKLSDAMSQSRMPSGTPLAPQEFILLRGNGTSVPVEITLNPIREVVSLQEDKLAPAKGIKQGKSALAELAEEKSENELIFKENSGKNPILVGVIRNVTQRKMMEQEREALIEELEAKNAELERFTYTVSHDLKSPLITIRGFLGYLESAALRGDTERVKEDISRITGAVVKMQQLLDELLELSRVGRIINPPEDVDFGELAREAVNMVAGRQAEAGVQVEIAPAMPVVQVDRPRVREVLENLLDNAIKYIGENSEPHVKIDYRRDGEEVVFFVKDNGMGIHPRYHERIFGLFNKLDQKTEGTGVGLAIAKRIVEVHGGRIWVESEGVGKGTTFYFTLPETTRSTAAHGE
jgi:PAS domain S-box-containing protein